LGRSQGDSQNFSDTIIVEYRDVENNFSVARTESGSFDEPDTLDVTCKGRVVFTSELGIRKTVIQFESGAWEGLIADKAQQQRNGG